MTIHKKNMRRISPLKTQWENAMAEGPLETKQVYKLLQWINQKNKEQMLKMVHCSVPNLINLTEPNNGIYGIHLTAMSNDLGMASFLFSLNAHPDIQDKMGRSAMMLSAERGHVDMVKLLASHEAKVNLVDKDGKGLLFYSISPTTINMEILEMALSMGADINNISNAGKSVFMLACERAKDCENFCLQLLEKGVDPNATDPVTGCSALMAAVKSGSVELMKAILERGVNPNTFDKRRQNAVYIAAYYGFFEMLRILSAYSADFNQRTMLGNTALHAAAAEGQAACCRFLFQRGCSVNTKNDQKFLPSQIAKNKGHKAALKELKLAEKALKSEQLPPIYEARLHDWSFEHKAKLTEAFKAEEEETGSPLKAISPKKFVSILQAHHAPIDNDRMNGVASALGVGEVNVSDFFKGSFLPATYELSYYHLDKKKKTQTSPPSIHRDLADTTKEVDAIPHAMSQRDDTDDQTASVLSYCEEPKEIYIHINQCVITDDFEMLQLAFSQNIPVDIRDRFYKTPLMTACIKGKYQMANFLISHGANVNAHDQLKWTCLHHTCLSGRADIAKLLLEHDAIVEATTLNGVTPLMRAIQSSRHDCVELLLNNGADVNATNKHGQSSLDLAQMYGSQEICDLLERAKGKETKKSGKGMTPAKTGAKEKTQDKKKEVMGSERCMIALNPEATDHCITLRSITLWGKMVVASNELECRKSERETRFANEGKLVTTTPSLQEKSKKKSKKS